MEDDLVPPGAETPKQITTTPFVIQSDIYRGSGSGRGGFFSQKKQQSRVIPFDPQLFFKTSFLENPWIKLESPSQPPSQP